jgi:serine protease AprX
MMAKKPVREFASIFLLMLVILGHFPMSTEAADDKISSEVRSLMLEGEKIPVIIILKSQHIPNVPDENIVLSLKSHASEKQKNLISLLEIEKKRGNVDKIKQFWIVNAIALNASPQLIDKLSKHDDIEIIQPDFLFSKQDYLISSGPADAATSELRRINATQVWEYGINGSGINVSIIDTGIKSSHPDIAGRVTKWVDYVNFQELPYDDDGHGTHVAGTVGGNGVGGIITGVAPNASLFGAKVLDSSGNGYESNIIKGIEWSIENKANIISMSLASFQTWTTPNCDNSDISMTSAIDNSIAMGVIVVAAAGNGPWGVASPACKGNAIAVGAVDSNDLIASFSGRGAAMTDHGVVAPGVGITSLNYLNSGYKQYSGTSMATPHASGTFALILEAAKKKGIVLTPAQAKNILMNSSRDLGYAGKDNIYGAGRIDAFEAVKGFLGRGYVNGTVLDTVTRNGIADAIVTTNTSISTVTNGNGFYSLDLMEGSYYLTVIVDPEYYPNNSVNVKVSENSTTMQYVELIEKPKGSITGSVKLKVNDNI